MFIFRNLQSIAFTCFEHLATSMPWLSCLIFLFFHLHGATIGFVLFATIVVIEVIDISKYYFYKMIMIVCLSKNNRSKTEVSPRSKEPASSFLEDMLPLMRTSIIRSTRRNHCIQQKTFDKARHRGIVLAVFIAE
ncbi:unnamed protein product [Amoebophrya sp. A25]|nr:unnamed protein product [Amoebophrya sp. A25]|eukprot:GSA25T00027521001.1